MESSLQKMQLIWNLLNLPGNLTNIFDTAHELPSRPDPVKAILMTSSGA